MLIVHRQVIMIPFPDNSPHREIAGPSAGPVTRCRNISRSLSPLAANVVGVVSKYEAKIIILTLSQSDSVSFFLAD